MSEQKLKYEQIFEFANEFKVGTFLISEILNILKFLLFYEISMIIDNI